MLASSRTQAQTTETISPSQERKYTLIDANCDNEACLFVAEAERDFLIGAATVSGYYVRLERSAFDQTERCHSFVLTEGPPALIRSLLSLIEHGNTLYTKNDLNQPVISLDLSTLTEAENRQIVSSSASEPISLVLLATGPSYQGVPVCFSHFEILRVR